MDGTASRGKAMRRAARSLSIGLCAAVVVSGCATKKDVKQVRDELIVMQARQDSLFREMQRQNRMLLDTLRSSFLMQADAQGQTSFRTGELADQVARIEQAVVDLQTLVGQMMERDRLVRAQSATTPQGPPAGTSAGAADAYNAGMQSMGEQSYPAARIAFQAVLDNFPDDPVAADAQFQIAESFAAEGDTARAIAEFEKVESNWPRNEARASQALLRAGILSEESGDKNAARDFYGRIAQLYPNTDAARTARERASRIRG